MNVYSRIWPICWTVARAADPATPPPGAHAAHRDFLGRYALLCRADESVWFLSAADYAGTADSAFAWDEFKHLSLDAALDDEDRQGIHTFWDRHLPVLMSVAGDYEFWRSTRTPAPSCMASNPSLKQ